ncbi:Uncharacterised protein [Clostridium putrefaciens]|uniref:Uncharacterized protein n=1 Tax=Clostridium putrefaciens TaxID=99675 RepID=A0A381J5T9_9CLOT|nr:hypothetical protein [Clostridium putrefaciens]SUY46495.1 Uncharacterised protein [Clostridium putrefaciens]
MKLLRKYKTFIIAFAILFFIFARIIGIKEWGNIILWISIILFKAEDVIKYKKEIGIVKFAILGGILLVVCVLTALIFFKIGSHFTLSTTFKTIIIIVTISIDVAIILYLKGKLEMVK